MNTNEYISNIQNNLDKLKGSLNKQELQNLEVKENEFIFAGKFNNGETSATFKSSTNIKALTDLNLEEVTKVLSAFGNYERFKIISLLLEKGYTAGEIMQKLNFKTTGKVYHHLNSLQGAGIIFKDKDHYRLVAKRIQGILAMLMACHSYISKSRGDIIEINKL